MDADAHPRRHLTSVLETPALLAVAAAVTLRAEWAILFHTLTYQPDALIHEWWMRQWRDPSLFHDPLTAAVKATGFVPVGVRAVDRAAALVVDPVTFAAWLPLVLVPASAWLVFAIVRRHTSWLPAAWIGALLYLAPVNIERFSGGHARGFAEPVVLLTLLLLLRGRPRAAAAVPPLGALLYPPGAAVALGVLGLNAALRRRPNLGGLGLTAASAALTTAAVLASGTHSAISLAAARAGGEFGANGQQHFFAPNLITYLSQNQSGFNLEASGSILAMAALVVLPGRMIRREVWMLVGSCLLLFAAAHAVLFRLYLPNRFVQPLVPAFAILAAVCWEPTFRRIRRRLLPVAAVVVPAAVVISALALFPPGPRLDASGVVRFAGDNAALLGVAAAGAAVVAVAVRVRADIASAVVAAALVIGAAYAAGGGHSPSYRCGDPALMHELTSLPVAAVIAGDPMSMNCVPIVAQRPVVISHKLNQPLEAAYAAVVRARMAAMIDAEYSPTAAPLGRLVAQFGARYLVVRIVAQPRAFPAAWLGNEPYTDRIASLLRDPAGPYVQRLGSRCLSWSRGADRVYDLRCLVA